MRHRIVEPKCIWRICIEFKLNIMGLSLSSVAGMYWSDYWSVVAYFGVDHGFRDICREMDLLKRYWMSDRCSDTLVGIVVPILWWGLLFRYSSGDREVAEL